MAATPLLFAADVFSKDIDYATARLERRLISQRADGRITVDGQLEEPSWTTAPVATNFVQSEPREGQPATFKTEVRVLYDEDNLYLAFTCFDPETDKLITSDLKKDFTPTDSDIVGFVLDTFHDRRNGFEFAINAHGARWDSQSTNESDRNANWDGVWYVRTKILADRWIAEVGIPFRTLKFSDEPVQTWGVNFLRRIRRLNEDSFWSPIPRIYRLNRVSLAGTLEDLEGVQPANNIRVKPYIVSSLSQTRTENRTKSVRDFDGGVDFKYGLNSGLTLDGTLNTDFSQVEADEQQVNLTRFSLFFPEKRDFFLENSGIFTFGTLGELTPRAPGQGSSGRQSSGSEDVIFFFSRRIGINDSGQQIPILGGARLSGRVGPWSMGFLNIQTRESGSTAATNFAVARVKRNVGNSSQIGGIIINKEERATRHFNRGYGADANFRFGQNLYLIGYYARTDSQPLSSNNDSYRVAGAYRNRRVDLRSIYTNIGANFNAEVGFVPRPGVRNWQNFANIKFRPAGVRRWIREIAPTAEREVFWNSGGRLETRYFDVRSPVNFQDGATFEVGRNSTFERLSRPFRIQNGVRIPIGDYRFDEYFAGYTSNRARRLSGNARVQSGEFWNGDKTTYTLGGTVRFGYRLNTSVNYSRNNVQLPNRRFSTDLVTTRLNLSFTTTVFLNALIQYNSDARQWSSNIRFNIIHRPLSDFFLVFNERRDTLTNQLLDRALIAKITYRIGS